MQIQPGEGERRAQRGYVPQYDFAASLVYEGLASGKLHWIGVADRQAGKFDDLLLGYANHIVAFQVKTSLDPSPFSLKTLLLGAENLLQRVVKSRQSISASAQEVSVETIYVCDNSPRTEDTIGDFEPSISSAAYLRAHEAHRFSWRLSDWKSSIYGPFVAKVQVASGLGDAHFETIWRYLSFKTGPESRSSGLPFPSHEDQRRIRQIAALLPRLVADDSDQDRWSVQEVLTRLQWNSPFVLRHSHAFPVDALYESNEETQQSLSEALHTIKSGYIALVGPPGSGKSTLLAAGVIPSPRARVLRYLAFVPGRGQGMGRAESFDFLHDLVRQFKLQGYGKEIIPGTELAELRIQLERLLGQAAEQYLVDGLRTIIVVDGLDHVPREERPQRSFLQDFPLPDAVPDGVLFLLGTQKLDLTDIPASVRDQASETGRLIHTTPLSPGAVARLAELAGVPGDVDRSTLYRKTGGHPLAVRYVIDALQHADGPEGRQKWLREGPAYGGDVDVFYNRAWHDLEKNPDAQMGMAYLALAEGAISPVSLDSIIGPSATDAVWRAASHLLRIDRQHNWSVFHNSFRLFLQAKLSVRHGIPNTDLVKARYLDLADIAANAGPGNGQQGLELRYRIRAEQFDLALVLATPDRFREQLFEGRPPEEIRADIALSFLAAKACRSITAVLSLIFAGHELGMRMEVIGDDLIDAYITLGFFDRARGLVDDEPFSMTAGKGFDLVATLLASGDLAGAKELFSSLEPLDVLLGAKELFDAQTETELEKWAEQALAFRTIDGFVTSLRRIRISDRGFHQDDPAAKLAHLKLLAARGQLMRNPEISPEDLVASLGLDSASDLVIKYFALKAAFDSGLDDLAKERLEVCTAAAKAQPSSLLLQISHIACLLSNDGIAKELIDRVQMPSLDIGDYNYSDDLRRAAKDVMLAASLRARFALPAKPGLAPKSDLLKIFQLRLEAVGNIHGRSLTGAVGDNSPLPDFLSFLDFLERAQGKERFDFERGRITRIMDAVLSPMLEAAHAHSDETLAQLATEIDDRLKRKAQNLSISSFRRSFAVEMFKYQHDSSEASRRIAYQSGLEDTPQSEFSEAAKTISALLQVELRSEAEQLLACIHTDGLGISRPAKKDAQYLLWENFLQAANRADPIHRKDRVLFMARFFSGLAETEGRGVAQRASSTLVQEAAMTNTETAAQVIDMVEDCDLSTWSDITESIALGAIRKDNTYSEMAVLIIGRLSIPFDSGISKSTLSELLRLAPEPELGKIADLLVACVQTDAPIESRILALETIADSIKRRGYEANSSHLARWRAELPPPKSGNSPEDPFFLVRSLGDISSLLGQHRGTSAAYGARSAFLRALEWEGFEAAHDLFVNEGDLSSDEHVIEAMARRSWAEGKREEATQLLVSLLKIAEDKGSWGGGWRSQAKLRYYRLTRDFGIDDVSSKAFDILVDDLIAGKESYEYILPDLHEILQVVAPSIDWASAWNVLAQHLSEFREYRRGKEITTPVAAETPISAVVADLIRRALGTTAIALVNLARAVAIEMSSVAHGREVLEVLLPELLNRGDNFAVEAAQIIWESRNSDGLKPLLESLLPQMQCMNDISVRGVAERLCEAWSLSCPADQRELPAIYSVILPYSERYASFEPPSGVSASSTGLYAEDALTWTWILEKQLQLASKASEIDLGNIRQRVAEIMRRMGGASRFGPDAVKSQIARMSHLSLHTTYTKLMSQTALQAFREAVGELHAANAIDPDAISFLEAYSGAYSPLIPTRFPVPRPQTVHAVRMPEIFGRQDEVWIDSVVDDLVKPTLIDGIVLATISTHERGFREDKWVAEQYFGPKMQGQDDELFRQLHQIPSVLVTDRVTCSFSRPCPGFVAHVQHTIPGFEVCPLSLCPLGAAVLGWIQIPDDVFTYTDKLGAKAAWILYWRDGGVVSREADSGIHRHGFALVVDLKYGNQLQHVLPSQYEVLAWRRQEKAGDTIDFTTARRDVSPPI